jgi:hypothetical protein
MDLVPIAKKVSPRIIKALEPFAVAQRVSGAPIDKKSVRNAIYEVVNHLKCIIIKKD